MGTKKTSLGSSLLLFLAAFIWGVAFVAQSVGMEYMGPCTFNGSRFIIGSAVLVPVIRFRQKKQITDGRITQPSAKQDKKLLLFAGLCCGLALCAASLFQQFGIQYTTVGKAGFITTLYIIIVPVMGIFIGNRIGARIWVGAVIAVAGMYLLCVTEGFSVGYGDLLVLVCALLFSVHILVVDHFSPKVDSVELSCLQFLVSGIICTVFAFVFEKPSLSALMAGAVPVLYAGILSCGVAYTLQVVGQKKVEPTIASMILSMESVVSVLAGWVLLNQQLSHKELWGCILVFAAVILVQLPDRKVKKTDVSSCKEDSSVVN